MTSATKFESIYKKDTRCVPFVRIGRALWKIGPALCGVCKEESFVVFGYER